MTAIKLVSSRLGEHRLRVAGTTEFNGYDRDIRADRIQPCAIGWPTASRACTPKNVVPWAGLRPMTPTWCRASDAGEAPCVFCNTGHRHLGEDPCRADHCGDGRRRGAQAQTVLSGLGRLEVCANGCATRAAAFHPRRTALRVSRHWRALAALGKRDHQSRMDSARSSARHDAVQAEGQTHHGAARHTARRRAENRTSVALLRG